MTLRDHKPNFAHKPTCRLTNPIKYNIGRFSKTILDRINNKITRASRFNQWRNTASVIEWFKALPLHQPRPPEQSTRLSFSLRHHQRRRTIIASCNTCKTFDPYAQTATLAKEGRYKIWRLNGQLRRCWNMRACRKPFLLFLSTKPQHQHRTLPRRRTGHFKRHTERNRQQKIYRGFFRRGVVRSCSVMVEEYSTIAERFLTTPRRKNRAISTQNALESLLLLQPWYDHSLQRHIRLQVYQEPLSDRLVKGIWRWHAKDDIYKTF